MPTLVDLSKYLSNLADNLQPQQRELQTAADNQVKRINDRTDQGISVDLQVFAPYARRTHKTSPVTLRSTGEMLSDVRVEADNDKATISFQSPAQAQKATYHNQGTKHLPQRFFFGASLQDREEIVADVRGGLFQRVNNG